jgi:hypothetical protein
MKEMIHESTKNIKCPYCDYEHEDSYEWKDECGNTECHSCDKEFYYSRYVKVTYSTGVPR